MNMNQQQQEDKRQKICLKDPWCELVLGFDKACQHVYYLSTDKPLRSWIKNADTQISEHYIQINIAKKKSNSEPIIVKYNIDQEKVVTRFALAPDQFDDEEGEEIYSLEFLKARETIKEAFINKNDIIPYLDTEQNSVILHIVPSNAAVSFRFDEDEIEV